MLHLLIDLAPLTLDWLARAAQSGSEQLLWGAPAVSGPAAGGGTYYAVYKRYRNQDATYEYEHSSRVELSNIGGHDAKVDHRSRTTDQHTRNIGQSMDPRQRVHGKPDGLSGFFGLLG